jgi:tellurite resistance protein TehA-like permease
MNNPTPNKRHTLSRHSTPLLKSGHSEMIRQFTPNWFAMTMGTGILFLILLAAPVEIPARRQIAMTLWTVDSMLFCCFTALFAARFIRFPQTIRPLLDHPAISVPLAFSILTIVFLRLALHKLPHRDMAASSWLTLGPIGTGSLGMLVLGQAAPALFAGTPLAQAAIAARDFGLVVGLLMWGVGIWWLLMATVLTVRYQREGMTFNLGW